VGARRGNKTGADRFRSAPDIAHCFPPKIPCGSAWRVIDFPPETDLARAELPGTGYVEKGFQFTEVGCRLSLDVR
jgi:hypothetical protein